MTLETGEGAGRVDPSTAVVKVAMRARLAAHPMPQKLGPIGLVDIPDEKPILGLCGATERKTGERML